MDDEIRIDMTKARRRRRRRSKRDIEKFWNYRYNKFIDAGFRDEEATWAANEGLSPRNKEVRKRVIARRGRVEGAMEEFGWSRKEAVRKASDDLRDVLDDKGIEEWNIFYETS